MTMQNLIKKKKKMKKFEIFLFSIFVFLFSSSLVDCNKNLYVVKEETMNWISKGFEDSVEIYLNEMNNKQAAIGKMGLKAKRDLKVKKKTFLNKKKKLTVKKKKGR